MKRPQELNTLKDYKTAMRRLRGKVSFNYSLRREVKYTAAQKANISRALNALPTNPNARLIKPRRKPKESTNHYNARLQRIKKNSGQKGNSFTGVFTTAPKGTRTSFIGDVLTIKSKKSKFKEKLIQADAIEIETNLEPYVTGIMQRESANGFTTIAVVYHSLGNSNEFDIDNPSHFIESILSTDKGTITSGATPENVIAAFQVNNRNVNIANQEI